MCLQKTSSRETREFKRHGQKVNIKGGGPTNTSHKLISDHKGFYRFSSRPKSLKKLKLHLGTVQKHAPERP